MYFYIHFKVFLCISSEIIVLLFEMYLLKNRDILKKYSASPLCGPPYAPPGALSAVFRSTGLGIRPLDGRNGQPEWVWRRSDREDDSRRDRVAAVGTETATRADRAETRTRVRGDDDGAVGATGPSGGAGNHPMVLDSRSRGRGLHGGIPGAESGSTRWAHAERRWASGRAGRRNRRTSATAPRGGSAPASVEPSDDGSAGGDQARNRAERQKRPGRSRALRLVKHEEACRGRSPGGLGQKSRWTRKRTCETESCVAVRTAKVPALMPAMLA